MPGVLAEEMEEKEKVFYAAEQHYIYRGGVYQPIHEMEAHVSPVIHRYMRSVEIDGDKGSREAASWEEDEVGAIKISTDLSPIERQVGVARTVAKLNMRVAY